MRWLPALFSIWIAAAGYSATPVVTHYFDEATNRQAIVTEGDFGKITLVFRFVGGPGSFGRWNGDGTRKDGEITFSQTVGEDQPRGTVFVAKASETKLEVAFKPKQRMPVDAGINGTYRHISEEKRTSVAKKESALADDALAVALKTAPKTWPSEDRPVAADWKGRWPDLRKRWMNLVFKPADPPAAPATPTGKPPLGAGSSIGSKSGDAGTPAPSADYWTALSETTGMGMAFINQPLDKNIPDTDGDYDDGFGGRVSLRTGTDGFLRFTLSCFRGTGDSVQAGELIGRIPATQITKEKNGAFTDTYTHKDTDLKPEDRQATVKLHKAGHFLTVETQYAERYCARAWFDGIYRWGPVPPE
jgi:hypothetical protein